MTEQTNVEQPSTVYNIAPTQRNMFLIMGIIAIAVGIFIVPYLIGFGVFFIVMYFVNSNLQPVRIHPEYSEIKLALARPRHYIKNTDVKSVSVEKGILKIQVDEDGEEKTREIILRMFAENDKNEIVKYYETLAAKNQ